MIVDADALITTVCVIEAIFTEFASRTMIKPVAPAPAQPSTMTTAIFPIGLSI